MNKTAILIFLAIFDTLLILFHNQDPVLNIPCSDIQFRATFPVLSYIRVLPRPNTTVPAGNHLITLNFIPDDNLNVIEQQSTVIYDIAENFDSNPISLPFLRSTRFNVTCSSDVDNLLITLYKSSFLGCNAIILLLLSTTVFFTIIIIIAKEIFYEHKKRQHLIPILLSVIFFIVLHIIAASIISKGLRIRDFPAQAKFIFSTPFISFQALQSYISKNIINKIISFVSPLRLESVNILLAQQPQSPESNKRIDTISPFLLTLTIISIIVSSLIFIVGLPYRQVIYSLLSVCFTIISSVMWFETLGHFADALLMSFTNQIQSPDTGSYLFITILIIFLIFASITVSVIIPFNDIQQYLDNRKKKKKIQALIQKFQKVNKQQSNNRNNNNKGDTNKTKQQKTPIEDIFISIATHIPTRMTLSVAFVSFVMLQSWTHVKRDQLGVIYPYLPEGWLSNENIIDYEEQKKDNKLNEQTNKGINKREKRFRGNEKDENVVIEQVGEVGGGIFGFIFRAFGRITKYSIFKYPPKFEPKSAVIENEDEEEYEDDQNAHQQTFYTYLSYALLSSSSFLPIIFGIIAGTRELLSKLANVKLVPIYPNSIWKIFKSIFFYLTFILIMRSLSLGNQIRMIEERTQMNVEINEIGRQISDIISSPYNTYDEQWKQKISNVILKLIGIKEKDKRIEQKTDQQHHSISPSPLNFFYIHSPPIINHIVLPKFIQKYSFGISYIPFPNPASLTIALLIWLVCYHVDSKPKHASKEAELVQLQAEQIAKKLAKRENGKKNNQQKDGKEEEEVLVEEQEEEQNMFTTDTKYVGGEPQFSLTVKVDMSTKIAVIFSILFIWFIIAPIKYSWDVLEDENEIIMEQIYESEDKLREQREMIEKQDQFNKEKELNEKELNEINKLKGNEGENKEDKKEEGKEKGFETLTDIYKIQEEQINKYKQEQQLLNNKKTKQKQRKSFFGRLFDMKRGFQETITFLAGGAFEMTALVENERKKEKQEEEMKNMSESEREIYQYKLEQEEKEKTLKMLRKKKDVKKPKETKDQGSEAKRLREEEEERERIEKDKNLIRQPNELFITRNIFSALLIVIIGSSLPLIYKSDNDTNYDDESANMAFLINKSKKRKLYKMRKEEENKKQNEKGESFNKNQQKKKENKEKEKKSASGGAWGTVDEKREDEDESDDDDIREEQYLNKAKKQWWRQDFFGRFSAKSSQEQSLGGHCLTLLLIFLIVCGAASLFLFGLAEFMNIITEMKEKRENKLIIDDQEQFQLQNQPDSSHPILLSLLSTLIDDNSLQQSISLQTNSPSYSSYLINIISSYKQKGDIIIAVTVYIFVIIQFLLWARGYSTFKEGRYGKIPREIRQKFSMTLMKLKEDEDEEKEREMLRKEQEEMQRLERETARQPQQQNERGKKTDKTKGGKKSSKQSNINPYPSSSSPTPPPIIPPLLPPSSEQTQQQNQKQSNTGKRNTQKQTQTHSSTQSSSSQYQNRSKQSSTSSGLQGGGLLSKLTSMFTGGQEKMNKMKVDMEEHYKTHYPEEYKQEMEFKQQLRQMEKDKIEKQKQEERKKRKEEQDQKREKAKNKKNEKNKNE